MIFQEGDGNDDDSEDSSEDDGDGEYDDYNDYDGDDNDDDNDTWYPTRCKARCTIKRERKKMLCKVQKRGTWMKLFGDTGLGSKG